MKKSYRAVKWVDDDIIETAEAEMLPRIEEWRNPDVDFTSGWSFDEIRNLATVVSVSNQVPRQFYGLSFDERRSLETRLNEAFDALLEDLLPIYNWLYDKFHHEKWTSDQRYKLLALHSDKGCIQLSVLKNVVWFIHMKEKAIDIESSEELYLIMTTMVSWEFGYEYKGYDWENNSRKFKVANECMKKEIQAQNDFVQYVLEGDIQGAYDLIEKQIIERL